MNIQTHLFKTSISNFFQKAHEYLQPIPYIMIVDDSSINILMLAIMLKNIGVNDKFILQVNDGHEAIELIEKYNIKIIFMDIEMPVINGFQTTQLIKKSKKLKNKLNIIAYTSLNDDETILKCKDAGMDYYLEKPCNIKQVSNVIENYYLI